MGLTDVSNILWRERQLLDLLQFKLLEEQLLVTAGHGRWLAQATREVEMVLQELAHAEADRASAVDAVGDELGLPPDRTLRALAQAVDEPWRAVLDDHRRAFLAAVEEIKAVAEANRELLARGQQVTRDALSWLLDGGPPAQEGGAAYSASGAPAARGARPARVVDRAV